VKIPRAIVHLDADAFFASVEQAADPRLRGKPMAVGGEQRGIIASASYEARKFGVYTPMPTVRARKLCPKLIVVPGDFEKYERFSRWMFSYAYDFTPDVEIGSIDEGYFDLSGTRKSPVEIAETIRKAIRQSLKITVSEGIGSSKLVSQIASKLHKPSAFFHVPTGEEIAFLHPLANRWLPGVGPKTAERLNAAGLACIRQVAATSSELLSLIVGRGALQLRQFANGVDERPIIPVQAPAKSYSQQETFDADQTDEQFIEATLRRMADQLMLKVREDRKSIRTLTVKVRYNDMAEDQRGESLAEPTDLETDIYPRLRPLLRQAWKRRVSLRLVSLKFSNLYESFLRAELPLENEARRHEAQRRLAFTVDQLRQELGRKAVFRGHDFLLEKNSGNEAQESTSPPSAQPGEKVEPANQAVSGALRERIEPYKVSVLTRQKLGPFRTGRLKAPSGRVGQGRGSRPSRVQWAPLRVRSYYSFLDSTLSIEALVQLAVQYELPFMALADVGNLHGAVEFVQAAKTAGIKPVLGVDFPGTELRLYVENATGYHNLCRILNRLAPLSNGQTFFGEGADRLRWADLAGSSAAHRDGLPSQSKSKAPPNQRAAGGRCFAKAQFEGALEGFTEGLIAASPDAYWSRVFPGRFYREISGLNEMRRLERNPAHPCIWAPPIRYAQPADRWKYDVVQSIRTLTLLRQEHPEKDLGGRFHFPEISEVQEWGRLHPELPSRTLELAERCSFDFVLGRPQFPAFHPPDGSSAREFLRTLVMQGLKQRYAGRQEKYRPQIQEELEIIHEVGYEEYFLVVWDILQECRRRGIEWITRGSAADSLVCYCLGISDVCPIRFDLYFRRFLNKERMQLNKLPDIDLDFPHDRKDDVIDLIFEKYGAGQTAVVGGFSTYQARSALGDVAKVLGVSEHQVRRVTERLPHYTDPSHIAEAVAHTPECADLPLHQEPYRTALRMARFLDGFPRYPKMHPCGLVLSRQPMEELVPCFISNKGYPTAHFDMDSIEAIGLVKMDILAQGGLSVMRDARAKLAGVDNTAPVPPADDSPDAAPDPKENRKTFPARSGAIANHKSPIANCKSAITKFSHLEPWDDPAVWEMIAGGGSRAVHHIESPAMVSLCKMCNARDIDTLIAIVSVIRPGAANESKKMEFARRYQGLSPVIYPHPSLEPCLKSTFGLVVYEEHILQMCELFAGLPPGRADVLRRALGKDKTETIAAIEKEFQDCARARGRTEESIAEVWGLVSGFRGYAFCKAHSTAYGVEAYQSAWLKRYHPAEFMAAVLTNGKGFYRPLVYVLECHRLEIPLLPPWVNEPGPAFQVVRLGNKNAIRVPVGYIKGLTVRTCERLLAEHRKGAFQSMVDFYFRAAPGPEEFELLLRAGALDGFGKSRTELFWEIQMLTQGAGPAGARSRQEPLPGAKAAIPPESPVQGWLFSPPGLDRLPATPLEEPSRRQRLEWEAELLGFPASGHPLELFDDIAWDTYCPVERLGRYIGEEVVLCGLIIEDRIYHQATGEPMKFLTLADWTGMVETELFARTYKNHALATVRYPVLEVTARVEPYENGRGYSLRVLRAGKPRRHK
jgi:DNA-directed DNA polymerase III PolC